MEGETAPGPHRAVHCQQNLLSLKDSVDQTGRLTMTYLTNLVLLTSTATINITQNIKKITTAKYCCYKSSPALLSKNRNIEAHFLF